MAVRVAQVAQCQLKTVHAVSSARTLLDRFGRWSTAPSTLGSPSGKHASILLPDQPSDGTTTPEMPDHRRQLRCVLPAFAQFTPSRAK